MVLHSFSELILIWVWRIIGKWDVSLSVTQNDKGKYLLQIS